MITAQLQCTVTPKEGITVSQGTAFMLFNFSVSIQEDGFIKELSITMQLLRNCLYQNEECKVSREPQTADSSSSSEWLRFI
jgi:hypothetical protein